MHWTELSRAAGITLPRSARTRGFALFALALAACGGSSGGGSTDAATADVAADSGSVTDGGADATTDAPALRVSGVFELGAALERPEAFYDLPMPSDLRLSAAGTPDLRGFLRPERAAIVAGILETAQQRRGWATLPVAYFRFTGPLQPRDPEAVIAATPDAPALLVDVDPSSPERGRLVPLVAWTPGEDSYLPADVLALAPRPGFVLRSGRRYAFVVRASANDASGRPLVAADAFAALRDGRAPSGPRGPAASQLYQPLWDALRMRNVAVADVVAATVFTTADIVADTAALTERVQRRLDVTLEDLRVAQGDSPATHPRYCHLQARVRMPQFQQGAPPFNTEGLFRFDADGMPVATMYPSLPDYGTVPVSLTIPRRAMPAGGYPLALYVHGSGGRSDQAVNRGTWRPQSASNPCTGSEVSLWQGVRGCNTSGEGPAHHLAQRGIATAAAAMPVNPERLPGATGIAYLNFANLKATRDTFRQGIIEQRLLTEALTRLRIPASVMAGCSGATLPSGVTEGSFDTSRLVVMGQSMGGMYTNLIAATDPTVRAAIPTGAGGFWGHFILNTGLIPGVSTLLLPLLMTNQRLTFMHPALSLLELAWEPVEPIVFTPRLWRDPLPMHPARPVYEPVGRGDSYFPTVTFDAMALAYGHTQAGAEVWPTMQQALALDGRSGIAPYPVRGNVRPPTGDPVTGVVVQYEGDGVYDPHAIYSQLDAVKYQYGCFAESFVRTGVARVPDPAGRSADAPCE